MMNSLFRYMAVALISHSIRVEGRRKKIEETLGYIDQRLGELEQEKEEVFVAACHCAA